MIALNSTYDPLLALISISVAILSSFVALATVPRIHCTSNTQWDSLWSFVFGTSMGTGIWSMHFIGMMAFELSIPVYYDITLTIASLLLAIIVCTIAVLPLRKGGKTTVVKTIYVGSIVGIGIAGMHYMGMAAMRMNASMFYSTAIVLLSIAIAMVAASAALFIANQFKDTNITSQLKLKILAAIIMGLAVSSMHYIAMLGMTFIPLESVRDFAGHIDPHFLAVVVLVVTLLIQGGTLVAALLDEAYFAAKTSEKLAHQRSEIDQALFSILEVALEHRPLNEILDRILGILLHIDWLSVEQKGSIFVADTTSKKLKMVANRNLEPSLLTACGELDFGTCLCGQAALSQQVIHKHCIDHDHPIQPQDMLPHGHYCVPILYKQETLGVINLYVKHGHKSTPLELQLLTSVSNTIAGIIARKYMEEELERMSYHDSLTGLPNRTLLLDRLTEALSEARRYTRHVSVLFLDLDGFKGVNDTQGHQVGDTMLTKVAERLQSTVREMDTVARIGGDEFVVILRHADKSNTDAPIVAQKIINQMATPFLLGSEVCNIGCSIGIATFPADAKLPKELLRKADEAMYAVKHLGKNNFMHYSHDWSHVLSMSNPEIDQEHAILLEQLNALLNKIEGSSSNKNEVMLMLYTILDDTVAHFNHEEKLFVEKKYPYAKEHALIHANATKTLKAAIASIEAEPDKHKWVETCLQIKALLVDHVLKEDIKYIQYLRTE